MKSIQEFNFKLEGESHSVNAKLLSEIIIDLNIIITEIVNKLNIGNELELKVETFQKGSFDILFGLGLDPALSQTIYSYLNKENIELAGAIISSLSDIFSIKQFLGGDKPKKIEPINDNEYNVENNSGEVKIINNNLRDLAIYNPIINITVNNTFNNLNEHSEVEGIAFKTSEDAIKIARNEFPKMMRNLIPESEDVEEVQKERTKISKNISLSIFKIVFDSKYKWQFFDTNGMKISANIKDQAFFEKIKNGSLQFSNGDLMIVNMNVLQVYNEIGKTYENRSYIITKVIDIKKIPKQGIFDL
ncbi:hypothetical protein [Empedobacter sedimenti]|uniref:hypothetical protein n=1 Tax=Empedobacter sedimenti TaxID=3042610 RepID=UPI0024A700D5|nr:hypothetical protein [Empedobacter sedimenti]